MINFERDVGRKVYSLQKGHIVSIERGHETVIGVKLEGVTGPVSFEPEEFDDVDRPQLAVGRRVVFETGAITTPCWYRYATVRLEPT